MKKIQIQEEYLERIVNGEIICPICGQEAKNGVLCHSCERHENAGQIEKLLAGYFEAKRGHQASVKNVKREVLDTAFGSIVVDESAQLMFPKDPAVDPYLRVEKKLNGHKGFVEIFIFGADKDQIGQRVSGVIDLKEKKTKFGLVPYIRMQVVQGVDTAYTLAFNSKKFSSNLFTRSCSYRIGKGKFLYTVGFEKAG